MLVYRNLKQGSSLSKLAGLIGEQLGAPLIGRSDVCASLYRGVLEYQYYDHPTVCLERKLSEPVLKVTCSCSTCCPILP
jgi:hypothetical protein